MLKAEGRRVSPGSPSRRRRCGFPIPSTLSLVLAAALPALAVAQSAEPARPSPGAPASPSQQATGEAPRAAAPAPRGAALLADAFRRLERRDLDGAQRQFELAVAAATEDRDAEAEARGRYGLGKTYIGKSEYPPAKEQLLRSLAWFARSPDRGGYGAVLRDLGFTSWALGDRPAALGFYERALAAFEAAGDRPAWLSALYSVAFNTPPGPDRERLIRQGVEAAISLGDTRRQGLLWHLDGDGDYARGNYDAAAEKLARAARLLEAARARPELARVFTSMGRLYRVHGHPERAAEAYRRALRIQEAAGDRQGEIQSLDALGISLQLQGRNREARARYDEALARARRTGSPQLIARQLVHLASLCSAMGDHQKALALLEEAARARPLGAPDLSTLCRAYLGLGRNEDALAAANEAVKGAQAGAVREMLPDALAARARANAGMGRGAEALADLDEALAVVEGFRRKLIPTDFMRRGFGEQQRHLVSQTIELLHASGQHERAMEVAEQGRGRAFLDLLATRERARAPDTAAATLSASPALAAPSETSLRSSVAVPSMTAEQTEEAARRLGSTLVTYWVDAEAVYAWVVRPGEPVRGIRTPVRESQLRGWVSAMVPASESGRGGLELLARGGATTTGDAAKRPWRRLHDVLIRPIRAWLPSEPGSRVTLVPHGPLLALPFAALLDENGRYLVERHTLHSVPAAALLDFTARPRPDPLASPSYLLVADPVEPPTLPTGAALPRLPGTRREVQEIARQARGGTTTVLLGADARKQAVRDNAKGKTIVHFATHGVVRDDDPFESFLALSHRDRLTAREVYDLSLDASLVVLSGCRTARGRISGDGIVGLTRGFFYAGTPSVVASMWDVADSPTQLLMSRFYRSLGERQDKAQALRGAQLWLLRALRRGGVKVTTPLGAVTLPEHPVFWAGFVLQGEP